MENVSNAIWVNSQMHNPKRGVGEFFPVHGNVISHYLTVQNEHSEEKKYKGLKNRNITNRVHKSQKSLS